MLKKVLIAIFSLSIVALILGGVFVVWGYNYITRDLPRLDRIQDYQPSVVTEVVSRNGELIGEFYTDKRYQASIDEVPLLVRNAFLAAEDTKFYSHPGIDLVSIFRAAIKNFQSGSARQGGSTITQQVVKNLLLSSKKKITRKLKEAVLAYRIEQKLSKDEILQIYLNQIFFGNRSHGIKTAVKSYYRKELSEVTLAEAALLAGLPKAPSKYSPLANSEKAFNRQRYVLRRMVEAGFITEEEAIKAKQEKLVFYRATADTIRKAPYYTTEVRRVFQEKFPDRDLDREGYRIETAVDLQATTFAEQALKNGIEVVDKRRGWRGPIGSIENSDNAEFLKQFPPLSAHQRERGDKIPAMINQVVGNSIEVTFFEKGADSEESKAHTHLINLTKSKWARRRRSKADKAYSQNITKGMEVGDVLEVSPAFSKDGEEIYILDQTPELEGAVVLLNPTSGEVVAEVGGYNYSKSQFNRVTQSLRQPGSAFKPIVYTTAVDGFGYTAASIVYDEERTFKVGDDFWSPGNFDKTFLGPITLRTALQQSRNLVSADIISRIGVDSVIHYARKMGFSSPLGSNLSLSLGSSEVTLLEVARSYGVLANKGVFLPSVFITRILDREGEVIFDVTEDQVNQAQQVLNPEVAFVMANLMRGVVESGTGRKVKALKRPVAGKTGTSNDFMDTWFVGYTPDWVCGVWIGFDVKKKIGNKETGGRVAAPIFLDVMKDFLEYTEAKQHKALVSVAKAEAQQLGEPFTEPEKSKPADFEPPENIIGVWVDKTTGGLSVKGNKNAIYDYFVAGTQPTEVSIYDEYQSGQEEGYFDNPNL